MLPPQICHLGLNKMSVLVVLGFAHRYSEASRLRIEKGGELYHALVEQQEDPWVIVTGGDTTDVGETEATFLSRMAVNSGVPMDRILKEDEAKYTIEVGEKKLESSLR